MKAIEEIRDERDKIGMEITRLTEEQKRYTTEYPRTKVQNMIDYAKAQWEMLNWVLNYEA